LRLHRALSLYSDFEIAFADPFCAFNRQLEGGIVIIGAVYVFIFHPPFYP
jgi:hypothetical protein